MAAPDFSGTQAALRIRRLQQLCKQNALDGILLVPGVDGRFSVCNQTMGYLFDGRSNRDTIDVVKLDGQLDEAVALVTVSTVCLYAPSPDVHDSLLELLIPHVANLRILGPTKAERTDPDLLEENKLASFVHLLRGCRRLGIPCALAPAAAPRRAGEVPLSNGGPPHSGLPQVAGSALMQLERWPLLQAYGLEGVGRSGFFTMNFEVFDVQSALQHLYGDLDGRSLAVLLAEAVPTLRQHWDEMLGALGGKPAGQRGGLSEKQVVEPLAGYFAYGLLRPVLGVEQAVTLPPRAVFGPRSSDDAAASEATPLAACGPAPGSPPLHLVVEAADPRCPLRVARTYFLSRGVAEKNVFADPDEEAEQGYSFEAATAGWGPQSADAVMLMRLYTALVEAAHAAMAHFATVEAATALSAKAVALEVLVRRAEQLGVAGAGGGGGGAGGGGGGGAQALAAKLRFALCQCDHANHVTAPAVRGSRQLKILRLSLPDIASRSGPTAGKLLGGLVYGDTFLDLPHHPAAAAAAGSLLVLTEAVPPLVAIPAGGCEEELAARALRSLSRVVDRLAGAQTNRTANLASQRDQERRAAAAKAESEAVAARLRALRSGTAVAEDEEDEAAQEEEEELEGLAAGSGGAGSSGPSRAGPSVVRPAEALGKLLTLGGGEDAVFLTGAPTCPTLSGTLYCFSAGLVLVEAASRAVWVLDLRRPDGVQAVTMQQLPLAGPSFAAAAANGVSASSISNGTAAEASASGLGEAVVFRGTAPACGLAPACHLTTNQHVALALSSMSPAARRFLITSVLPAWQQTCREAAATAAESLGPGWAPSYLKDMAAPNPFPPALHRAHAYAIQTATAGGATKTWAAVVAEDGEVQRFLERMDGAELQGALSGLDPRIEALLLQPPPSPLLPSHSASATAGGVGGAVTLVVGLPGSDQPAVASAVASMLSDSDVAPLVALLPLSAGPLRPADFEAALAAAAGAPAAPRLVRHLVLVTSSQAGLHEQLGMLAAAAVGGAAGRWWLASVVVCCSADTMYEEPARRALAGGLLAQLAPGFVDCVVVGGTDTAKVASLAQLVSARLPDVPQVRSGRSQLLRARGELLPKPAERVARMAAPQAVAARCWAPLAAAAAAAATAAAGDLPGCSSGGLLGRLQAAVVVFEGAIDVAKLREALSDLGIPQDPTRVPPLPLTDPSNPAAATGAVSSPAGQGSAAAATATAAGSLVCLRACVRLTPGSRPSELVGSRQAGLRTREWPLAEAAIVAGAPQLPKDNQLPGGELLLVGCGPALQEPALRSLLARCGSGGGAAATAQHGGGGGDSGGPVPRTAAQLSPQQRAAIRQAHLFDPLPDGYCFNGTQYFDAFGDASLDHPEMDRFIAEWLAEQQSRAAAASSAAAAGGPVVVRLLGPVAV